MLVADLKSSIEGVDERSHNTTLGDMEVADDASVVRLTEVGEEFPLDVSLERMLAKYLKISPSYLAKSPPDLKSYNLNYWLRNQGNRRVVTDIVGDHVVGVHRPGLVVLPIHRVADVVVNTMDPQDEIVTLIRSVDRFHLDVTTSHCVEVPTDDRIEGRRQVGDITSGGIRLLANPMEVEAPVVTRYLHRLACTNGMTSPFKEGTISLKGRTVDEVIAEMEEACRQSLSHLDQDLADYAALATKKPPGGPAKFAFQLSTEYGLTQQITKRVMERVATLDEDAATLYDIAQVFTSIANSNVNYKSMMKLQALGGEIALRTDHVVHRCGQCTRLLPE